MSTPLDIYTKNCKDIGIQPLKTILEILKAPPKVMSFKKDYIGDKQLIALSSAMKTWVPERIILPGNGIMNQGLRALCQAISGKTVYELDLQNNDFSPSCVKDLCDLIKSTVSLNDVNIMLCAHMKPEHTRKIKEAMKRAAPAK